MQGNFKISNGKENVVADLYKGKIIAAMFIKGNTGFNKTHIYIFLLKNRK